MSLEDMRRELEKAREALTAEPCEITADGWCKTHSTTSGPAYCDREPETTERQIE